MFAASKSGSAADPTDAQFNYVTMLLHGDGTNGAQNNTFLDSSTNNFTVTRNGNTTQGTFTPYGSNWSNFFDGSGDRLTVPANATFNFSTGDFTVELWFYTNTVSGNQWIVGPDNTSTYPWALQTVGTALRFISNNAANDFRPTSFTLTVGTWNHFAVTRSGSTMSWFTNGTLNGTQTYSTAIGSNTIDVQIGTTGSGSGDPVNGYISNLRVVKGTAVYTSSFTPSTTPLTAITNTSLLTCQSNRFIDNSSNAFTLTKYNDVSVQRFSPFSPTTAYSTSVIGGSGYFDGSGDFLNTASSSAFNLNSVSWTIECYVYLGDYTGDARIWGVVSSATTMFATYIRSGTLYLGSIGSSEVNMGSLTKGQWYHLAFVNVSGTITCYINGVQSATTSSYNFTNTDCSFYVAATPANYSQTTTQGYISSLRVLKGTALYTTTFTPPTAPLTAITNTSLLLSFTNAGILDNAMMNDLETVGNAQISTSVKKYGTGSLAFDGTGDRLVNLASSPIFSLANSDHTIEMWIYANSFSGFPYLVTNANSGTSSVNWTMYLTTGGALGWGANNGPYQFSGGSISLSTWTHVAICQSGSNVYYFVNGSLVLTKTKTDVNNASWVATSTISVGSQYGSNDYNGYIDDLRITNYARYTATFTPPIASFADKG